MAGTAVVAVGCGGPQPVDVPALARSVRTLAETGWDAIVVAAPGGEAAGAALSGELTLALGQSRAGRRAVPIGTHVLIDPLDPALAHPPDMASPAPLAVLEAEAIGALLRSGFAVVVADQVPVVPDGALYASATARLDGAACAQRLAGDLGAGVLIFVTAGDGPSLAGDIDHREAERYLAGDPPCAAELRAAVRFLRAGGELAVITTPALVSAAVSSTGRTGGGMLRVHHTLARPRSEAPAQAAGWC
jgi:carbamate kinase